MRKQSLNLQKQEGHSHSSCKSSKYQREGGSDGDDFKGAGSSIRQCPEGKETYQRIFVLQKRKKKRRKGGG